MRGKDNLKLIAKGIKPLMNASNPGYNDTYGSYKNSAAGGYESPNSGKK